MEFFLNSMFLWALPLAAAPVVLHLIDRRRSVVIEWGAMQFLEEAATRKTSARRLQHWLLLALRVAAIALVVLALARPLVTGNWFGAAGQQETIFIVDTSMSTERAGNGQPVFDELIAKVQAELDAMKSGDLVRIMASSPYPVWVTPAAVRVDSVSRSALRDQVAALRPNQGTSDLLAALLKAAQSDATDDTLTERRLVLLTDGQRSDWHTENAQGWKHFREALTAARVPTSVKVVESPRTAAQPANIAVNQVRASRLVVGVQQPLTLTATVKNFSATSAAPSMVTWSVGEKSEQQDQLPALDGGQTHDIVWRHAFDQPGVYLIRCRAEAADALSADNAASIVVEAVEQLPIALIETADGLAEMQRDAYLVQAALGRIEGEADAAAQAVFAPKTIAPQQLETIDLGQFRAVVIPNLSVLSPAAVNRLHQFVLDGGGLWLALGARTDIREFNRLLFNDGDGLSPLAIDRVIDESSDETRQPTINPFVKDHPATADLANEQQLDTGEVQVAQRFRFRVPAGADELSVLLDLTNGDPLAVENHVGRGRVIVQAVPLRMQWSNLASSQAFVVMVHNWLAYLTEPQATRHNLLPGEAIAFELPDAATADATLGMPNGEDIPLTGEPVETGVLFRTSRTTLPGSYSLEIGVSGDEIPFHVARDAAESDLAALADADRAFLAETGGLTLDGRGEQVTASNHRERIWPALLVLLVAVICGELLLSGSIANERFGLDPIAESSESWTGEFSLSSQLDRPLPATPSGTGVSPVHSNTTSDTTQVSFNHEVVAQSSPGSRAQRAHPGFTSTTK